MKKHLFLLAFVFLGGAGWTQTIYTADNNPGAIGGVNTFTGPTALTDAIAAATAGDIIHVVRGSNDYGTTIVDKQLTLFGIGLNPDSDGNEKSIVSTLNIADPVASDTRISGLYITNVLNLGGGTAGTLSNLLIENCLIHYIQHLSATTLLANIVIRNNVLGSNSSAAGNEVIDLLAGAMSNIIIANNVIYRTQSADQGAINADNGTSVENNLFIGSFSFDAARERYWAFEVFNGNTVKNNIFLRLRPTGSSSFGNNTFENNLSFDTNGADAFSVINGNLSVSNLVGVDPLLLNIPGGLIGVDFSRFDPTPDPLAPSPAIGAGEFGTDMGVFGGASPMSIEGTLIPTIQSLNFQTIVVKGDSLAVQIKAKGN
jgi:hypothetical protein